MTAVSPTSLPPSHPRFGLSRRWTGPARVASPGSLFDAVLAARGLSIRRDTWFGPRPDFDKFVPFRYSVSYPRERTYGINFEMRFGALAQ